MLGIALAERGLVPEPVIRAGIRLFLRDRLAQEARHFADREQALGRFVERMGAEELAPSPQAANQQHYEVPTEFFQLALGRHLKYSSGLWEPAAWPDLDGLASPAQMLFDHIRPQGMTVQQLDAWLQDGYRQRLY